MVPGIGLVALAGEFEVGFQDTPDLLEKVKGQLVNYGFNVITATSVLYNEASVMKAVHELKDQDFDLFCVCVGTWSEDHLLLDLLNYFAQPVVLWAFPAVETGSLCGVQQICSVLKELKKTYFYVYGEPEQLEVLREIREIARAVTLQNRLKSMKIGTIGGRVKGMTEIAYDEIEIKDKIGVRVINLDEEELTAAFSEIPENQAMDYWQTIKSQVERVTSGDEQGVESVRYYFALKKLIKKYGLEGICVKCYPNLMGKVCLGYSLLSEEGIVGGCEGDVNGTVAMRLISDLTEKPVHNTDLLYPDPAANTILFSHCGSGGFSIAVKKEDINLAPVRLANNGVCVLFPAKPGKITLMNLVGRKGTYRMSVMVGEAINCEMEFPGNPLKVKFDKNVLEINKQIAEEGIGHHWMAGYGDVAKELQYFCKVRKFKYIRLA